MPAVISTQQAACRLIYAGGAAQLLLVLVSEMDCLT